MQIFSQRTVKKVIRAENIVPNSLVHFNILICYEEKNNLTSWTYGTPRSHCPQEVIHTVRPRSFDLFHIVT